MIVEHIGPELERNPQRLHASAHHVEIRSILREFGGHDGYNRMSQNAKMKPAPPRGTNANKYMAPRFSSMV